MLYAPGCMCHINTGHYQLDRKYYCCACTLHTHRWAHCPGVRGVYQTAHITLFMIVLYHVSAATELILNIAAVPKSRCVKEVFYLATERPGTHKPCENA